MTATEETAFQKVITRSYTEVDSNNGINTEQFLEATDGMINMFGKFNFFLKKRYNYYFVLIIV
jgi:hypothetical protein